LIGLPYEQETERLAKLFDAKVSVKTNAKGAGQIVIRFTSEEDFKRLQQLLEG